MTTKARNYKGLVHLIERTATDMYSDEEWQQAEHETEANIGMTYNLMLSEVYHAAFAEDPTSFEGVNWVNSDEGLPVWVRPGVNWQPTI
jgi:hypothetical protein